MEFVVSQHPKLKSGRFVKGVLAKVGLTKKSVIECIPKKPKGANPLAPPEA